MNCEKKLSVVSAFIETLKWIFVGLEFDINSRFGTSTHDVFIKRVFCLLYLLVDVLIAQHSS